MASHVHVERSTEQAAVAQRLLQKQKRPVSDLLDDGIISAARLNILAEEHRDEAEIQKLVDRHHLANRVRDGANLKAGERFVGFKAEDIIGETERQIQADEDRREAEIAELVNEPFDTAITPEGHEIDMRPPVLRAKKAEKDYEYYVGNGQHDEAVQMLVVRLAFTKLHHGPESMRTVKALLTLANAYLDLCQLPKQALRHAKAARDVFRSIKDSVSLAAHASRALMLESRILLAIARATVKRYESDAGAGAKKKAEQVAGKLQKAEEMLRHAIIKYSQVKEEDAHGMYDTCGKVSAADGAPASLAKAHGDTGFELDCVSTLGSLARLQKRFALSILYNKKAEALTIAQYGEADVSLFDVHRDIALAEFADGKAGAGAASFQKALRIQQDVYGIQSPEAAECLATMATSYSIADQERDAENALQDSLRIYGQLVDEENDAVTSGRFVLDGHYALTHEYERWLELKEELVRTMLRRQKYREAAVLINELIVVHCELAGTESVKAADLYNLLGTVYLTQQKVNKGIKTLKSADRIYRAVLGPEHKKARAVAKTLKTLAAAPKGAKNGKKAWMPNNSRAARGAAAAAADPA